MSGQSRINIAGLLCSFVTQAVILGGFFLPSWREAPPRAISQRTARPLIIEFRPLARASGKQTGSEHAARADRVSLRGTDRRDSPARQIGDVIRPVALAARAAATPIAMAAAATSAPAQIPVGELSAYQRRLFEIVARNSRYPAEARRLQLAGVTHLAFRIDRLGNVLDSWIEQSSGSELLDDAALAALERARPLPPIPPMLPGEMEFVVEIDSSLIQQRAQQGG